MAVQRKTEILRIHHQDGREHYLGIVFDSSISAAKVSAFYLSRGQAASLVADWPVSYVSPNACDPGGVQIGNGRIELGDESLRGLGIGSLLMIPLVRWIKNRPSVPVDKILLKGQDAATPAERDRRNGFYKKLGFTFEFYDNESWGQSHAMQSSSLIEPKFGLSTYARTAGWCIESVDGHGEVY